MTIYSSHPLGRSIVRKEEVKTEEEVRRENYKKLKYDILSRKSPEEIKEMQRKSNRRYYVRHREQILSKRREKRGAKKMFCKWCGKEIKIVPGIYTTFCRPLHRKLYVKDYKKKYFQRRKNAPVSEVPNVQHTDMPPVSETGNQTNGGTNV